ncbi:MAG: adenylate kinase [Acidimicrobiia bacterium]|nr:adenylate kinase [Acidimicrobiia bacterium]
MQRVAVVGTSGSGKTTVSGRLAAMLGVPHVELDSLHWEPGWTEAHPEVLRRRVESALSADQWVVDGNYSAVRDLIWPKADTLVWLDYRLARVMWQVTTRTARRIATREELWSGNRERFSAVFSRDSIIWWALTTYRKNRRKYAVLLEAPQTSHLKTVHLRSPREAAAWMAQFG